MDSSASDSASEKRDHSADGDDNVDAGSSSDDEASARPSFNRAPVLGGGSKRRRGGNDANLYGVFGQGPSAHNKSAKRANSSSAPISFVKGTTLSKTEVPSKHQNDGHDSNDDNDDIDPRFRFENFAQQIPDVEQGPKLPAKNKLSFGQMATKYGKGFAMLQKMGFQGGGLGARNDGIANPIEVNKRKGRQGIQDEGEMMDQDLYGHERTHGRASIEELLSPKAPEQGKSKKQEGWKKGATNSKQRFTYKTAAQVAAEPSAMRIVDMRGPDVRVVASFSELADIIKGDSVKSLRELRHNARLLVAKQEDRIRSLAEKKKYCEDVLLASARDSEDLKLACGLDPDQVRLCNTLVNEVEKLRDRHERGDIGLSELGAVFSKMYQEHPTEFTAIKAFDVSVALAVPVARRELAIWRPLENPGHGLSLLIPWKQVAVANQSVAMTALCDEVLLPRLRAALSDWSVRDYEACLRLFEACQESLPKSAVDTLVAEVVLPRLTVEVDAWDPRTDTMPIHVWIHPWLPFLGDKLEKLWVPIRFKLSASLEKWNPEDDSAYAVIKPWKNVFDPSNWEPLVEKVLSRLERAIREMPVRPDGQDVQPIKNLLKWLDVAPAASLGRVLDSAFFPSWHVALEDWLRAAGCDFKEVLAWYQGWRSLFPDVLREQGVVQQHLAHGLRVMKQMMSGDSNGQTSGLPNRPSSATVHPSDEKRESAAKSTQSQPVTGEEFSLSLSDYLAEVAGEHGLLFRPKARTIHLSKQVYQLGAATIYLDKNVVYAAAKGNPDQWTIVSMDELLSLAKSGKHS